MRRAGGNLLCSDKAEYIYPIVFRTYCAGQSHAFPVLVFVPCVPINRAISYTGTLIRVSQYLVSSTPLLRCISVPFCTLVIRTLDFDTKSLNTC